MSAAAEWLAAVLTGSAAVAASVLAVAGVGFLMLYGALPARKAARVAVGCFIVFSASAIATGIVGSFARPPEEPQQEQRPLYTPATPRASSADPYGGASVPDERTKDITN